MSLLTAQVTMAAPTMDVSTDVDHWTGFGTQSDQVALSRLTILPTLGLRFTRAWSAEIRLRAELADDDTGLGTIDTYSSWSRPLVDNEDARLEVDRATVSFRQRRQRLTLGKQSVPWGVLDGLQITDRFDAQRRRDSILGEVRPERLTRWGARWRSEFHGTRIDLAAALDPTVSQLAETGDIFAMTAPRLTAGAGATGSSVPMPVSSRSEFTADATVGMRLSHRHGAGDISLVAIHGPDTDPVIRRDNTGAAAMPESVPGQVGAPVFVPELDYPRRHLIGATYERSLDSVVLRAEAAYIPDQPLNVIPTQGDVLTEVETVKRTLLGVGGDWNAPMSLFVTAQLGIDLIDAGSRALYRPDRESIGTLRVARSFANDRWQLEGEWIGSVEKGDGVVRLNGEWQHSDAVVIALGADLLHGGANGMFGQFDDADRVWLRLKLLL